MADTARTRAALLTLMADNVTGQMSLQDFRDFMVTVMEEEFAYVGDFWKQPDPQQMSGDRTGRGWIDYSQTVSEACSFGDVLERTASGTWILATVSDNVPLKPYCLGMALDSYAASDADAQVLRRGLAKCAACSTVWSEGIGRPMFLDSGDAGKLSTCSAAQMSGMICVGYPEQEGSDVTTSATDVFRFEPSWGVYDR